MPCGVPWSCPIAAPFHHRDVLVCPCPAVIVVRFSSASCVEDTNLNFILANTVVIYFVVMCVSTRSRLPQGGKDRVVFPTSLRRDF